MKLSPSTFTVAYLIMTRNIQAKRKLKNGIIPAFVTRMAQRNWNLTDRTDEWWLTSDDKLPKVTQCRAVPRQQQSFNSLQRISERWLSVSTQVMAAFGANFNQAMDKMYSTGNSPIHVAALAGQDNVIQLLASRGLWHSDLEYFLSLFRYIHTKCNI